jgi:hypothetical protein
MTRQPDDQDGARSRESLCREKTEHRWRALACWCQTCSRHGVGGCDPNAAASARIVLQLQADKSQVYARTYCACTRGTYHARLCGQPGSWRHDVARICACAHTGAMHLRTRKMQARLPHTCTCHACVYHLQAEARAAVLRHSLRQQLRCR